MIPGEPWPKTPEGVAERFHAAVAGIEGVAERKMFGFPAAFIGGNMVAGTFRDSILIRLAKPDLEAQLASGWSTFEPMPGRPMTGFLLVPTEVAADADALRNWVERAADFVRTMPPKEPKPRKR
jgi:TfoX/Sxy family transcriptional regulator of competence genes